MSLLLCLLIAISPTTQAEEDIKNFNADDSIYIRYLYLDGVDEKDRDQYLSIVSFTLNSISNKRKIVQPVFIDQSKTVIRFDTRDYGIDVKTYGGLPVDPYTKKSDKLNAATKSTNPLIRADWFIIKALTAPTYYKLLGVSNLKDFRGRYGDDGGAKRLRAEQGAVVMTSNLARNTRYIKRVPVVAGAIWEARDSTSIDYLVDLLSDKYDSIQLLAFNPNGLISYYAADSKGNPMDYLSIDVAVDHSKAFNPDLVVRTARNCMACHSAGVMPIEDSVRNLLKNSNVELLSPKRSVQDRLNDLFGGELPIKKDQDLYKEALLKTTGMETEKFTKRFVEVWTDYYKDLTLEQAAKELGRNPDEYKKECLESGQFRLVSLAVKGKIHRVHFEQSLGNK